MLRLGRMNAVSVDGVSRTATVGGGAKWEDVVPVAHAHGLAPLSGSSPDVGVAGYLVGGGYGLMQRKYGLAVDALISATLVLADGSIVRANAEENADLFWAVRGGGAAFGVITEMVIGLVPNATVFGGNVIIDASQAPAVLRAWSEWTATAPDEVTSAVILITFPPLPFVPEFLRGTSKAIFVACVTDLERAEEILRPMRNLPGVEFDTFRPMPFTECASIFNDPVEPMPAIGSGTMLGNFEGEAVDAFLEAVGPIPQSPNLMIQLRHIGGVSATVPAAETPIGDRRVARYLIYCLGVPMPHNPPVNIVHHAEQSLSALNPWMVARGPLNWIGEATVPADAVRGVYDDPSFERLLSVKRTVDPYNLFRNASIGLWLAETEG